MNLFFSMRAHARRYLARCPIAALTLFSCLPAAPAADLTSLRCEYRVNPFGIDLEKPRLAWVIESDQRGELQTAYQVMVASTPELLARDRADLWDTGKVDSDQSIQVQYAGKPLSSRTRCHWKVRVWDRNGHPSSWSRPALWTMGLLSPEEWQPAKWIGEPSRAPGRKSDCQWVWYPEGTPNAVAPAGTRCFRRKFSVPAGKSITEAKYYITCDNGFTLIVNGRPAGQGTNWSQPALLNVASYLHAGENTIAITATNEGSAAGLAGKLVLQFADQDSLVLLFDQAWKTSDREMPGWTTAAFDDRSWPAALVLGPMGMAPWGEVRWDQSAPAPRWTLPPSPYLRKTFTVAKPFRRATVYATALGCYELRLNGARVGQDYFNPGWTEFRKRVYYHTYDVTGLLRQGDNALGAVLSDGWYSGYIWAGRDNYGAVPKLRVQLRIEHVDDTVDTVVTDETWNYSYGPIREGDVQQGETYDARLEMPGWDRANFNASNWLPVTVATVTNLQLGASPSPPVRRQQEIAPVQMTEPKPGMYVFNLGQNIAGWVRIRARGPRGTKIVLRHAGMLNPDGTIYTNYLREARAIDTYYLKGAGEEVWEPATTYHGFQYVEVTGYPGRPSRDRVTGIVCHSDLATVGSFECSDLRVNKLFSNILWTLRDNLVDIPTGCADRAERLGWCAKGPLVPTWLYTLDMGAFLSKWMVDLTDSQSRSASQAAFMQVAPFWGDIESPGWSDDGIWVPYGLYKAYGDTGIILKHYDAMARYIGYLKSKLVQDLRPVPLGLAADPKFPGYGDWLSINYDAARHNDVINTLLNGHSVKMMAEMAEAVGRKADATDYRELFDRMKMAFNRAYVSDTGEIRDKTQTEYALALYCGFIPDRKVPLAINHLVEDIQAKDHQVTAWGDAQHKNPIVPRGHLTTGFHGSRALLPALSRYGRNDVAYDLLFVDTYPSWLYPVKLGMSSVWERWDSWTPEKSFQDPAMNSFNMPDLMASVAEWLFTYVGGIGQEGAGFKNIVIKPYVGPGLTYAKMSYHSIHGEIAVQWEKKPDGSLVLRATIPANTGARIGVPISGRESPTIREGGTIVWQKNTPRQLPEGVKDARMDGGWVVFGAGAGSYEFKVK
jgi:alpha-L-rhamnosidase